MVGRRGGIPNLPPWPVRRARAEQRRRGPAAHPAALGWVQHIKSLGAGAVLFNPVWESDAHGYDTRDYFALDARLGTNEDFAAVCKAIHGAGMKVMLDGVFNHVGRGFWAFRDVQQKNGSRLIRIGSALISAATATTATASGTRGGRATTNL